MAVSRPLERVQGASTRLVRLWGRPPFAPTLVLHCSYHKCLTVLTASIYRTLSREFGFEYRHFRSRFERFHDAARSTRRHRVLSINNHSEIEWAALPDHRGSHFVRDPRDLLVSGYHYHLWTEEPWCRDERYDWSRTTAHPLYERIDERLSHPLAGHSYQSVLNDLDRDAGMLLELIRLGSTLAHMAAWDYGNPQVIELKYEEIIGNEEACFDRLFRHVGLHDRIRARGLELVHERSLAQLAKAGRTGPTRHVRSGQAEQWRTELSDEVQEVFLAEHGDLLRTLDYPT